MSIMQDALRKAGIVDDEFIERSAKIERLESERMTLIKKAVDKAMKGEKTITEAKKIMRLEAMIQELSKQQNASK